MGNSLSVIKQHYKQVVKASAAREFWRITPGFNEDSRMPSHDEVRKARSERLSKALAGN
jgi:hypothetical protein